MYGVGWNKVRVGLEVTQFDSAMRAIKSLKLAGGERIARPIFITIRKVNGQVYVL